MTLARKNKNQLQITMTTLGLHPQPRCVCRRSEHAIATFEYLLYLCSPASIVGTPFQVDVIATGLNNPRGLGFCTERHADVAEAAVLAAAVTVSRVPRVAMSATARPVR